MNTFHLERKRGWGKGWEKEGNTGIEEQIKWRLAVSWQSKGDLNMYFKTVVYKLLPFCAMTYQYQLSVQAGGGQHNGWGGHSRRDYHC